MGRVPWIDLELVPGVIGPTQTANDGSVMGKHKFLGVGVTVRELQTELREKLVGVSDVEIMVLLVAHDNAPPATTHESREHIDILRAEMMRSGMAGNCFVARVRNQ